MEEMLERGILRCFPEDDCLQTIVRVELLDPKHFVDPSKVDTLAFLTIKSMMYEELMSDEMDLRSQYEFRIIFREPIDINDFAENEPLWKPVTSKQPTTESEKNGKLQVKRKAQIHRRHSDGSTMFTMVARFKNLFQCVSERVSEMEPIRKASTSDLHSVESDAADDRIAQLHRLRFDGSFMFAIVDHHMCRFYSGRTDIILTRKTVQIRLNKLYIAEIPHRDGLEYDTFWAVKFTKLVMSKYAKKVSLRMKGEGISADLFKSEYMANYLKKSIINKLPRVIPAEGWEQYISEDRPVYVTMGTYMIDGTNYVVNFFTLDLFRREESRYYWGYLKSD